MTAWCRLVEDIAAMEAVLYRAHRKGEDHGRYIGNIESTTISLGAETEAAITVAEG